MAGLCWKAVMLAFILSAVNSSDAQQLETIVGRIRGQYRTDGMFSLAVMIPQNQNQNQNLQQVFQADPGNNVMNTMNNDEVYIGNRVVAAKRFVWPNGQVDHAELRVLANMQGLLNRHNAQDNFLLFYVYASSCPQCSVNNNWNILTPYNHAFVFTVPFQPRPPGTLTDNQRRAALIQLGQRVNMNTIFRCVGGGNHVRCTRCAEANNRVADYCYVSSRN